MSKHCDLLEPAPCVRVTDDQSAMICSQQLDPFSTRAIFIRGVMNHFEETKL